MPPEQVLQHADRGELWPRTTGQTAFTSIDGACQTALAVHALAADAIALAAGDIITTGTWTDARPAQCGQAWSSSYSDALHGLLVRLV